VDQPNVTAAAEQQLLAILAGNPNTIFDVDGIVLNENDFSSSITQCIYSGIKEVAQKNTSGLNVIDPLLLEERISKLFPTVYSAQAQEIVAAIGDIKAMRPIGELSEYVRIVVSESVRRKSKSRLKTLYDSLKSLHDPKEIIGHIERSVYDFTSQILTATDIGKMSDGFDVFLNQIAAEARLGNVRLGLDSKFKFWDDAIGGGMRRGTISVIAARSKMGKSFLGANFAVNIARQNIPVLYLDTELEKNYQQTRMHAIMAQVPLNSIETGLVFQKPDEQARLIKAQKELASLPFYYVSIKGWTIEQQISIIRRFYTKIVGRQPDGRYKPSLVILDYLKLMNSDDKGSHQEWEALGYRMTALHDLMSQYDASMLAFAQQNRSGLDKDDESTISGSDRIIWLCDNFSVLGMKPNMDAVEANTLEEDDNKYPNMKLRVVDCRHGPGTEFNRYVAIYADLKDPRVLREKKCGVFTEKGIEKA